MSAPPPDESRTERAERMLRDRELDELLKETCRKYRATPEEVCGRSRFRHVAWARAELWAAMWAAGLSFPAIADIFSRDHTTVMTGVEGHARRARGDYGPQKCWSEPSARWSLRRETA